MSEIKWTKCSERMPPYGQRIFLRLIDNKKYLMVQSNIRSLSNKDEYEWTPCTEEVWKELNG